MVKYFGKYKDEPKMVGVEFEKKLWVRINTKPHFASKLGFGDFIHPNNLRKVRRAFSTK